MTDYNLCNRNLDKYNSFNQNINASIPYIYSYNDGSNNDNDNDNDYQYQCKNLEILYNIVYNKSYGSSLKYKIEPTLDTDISYNTIRKRKRGRERYSNVTEHKYIYPKNSYEYEKFSFFNVFMCVIFCIIVVLMVTPQFYNVVIL